MPNFFNSGVAAKTIEPCLFVSATTANFVFKGSKFLRIQETLAKNFLNQHIKYPFADIENNHTFNSPHLIKVFSL